MNAWMHWRNLMDICNVANLECGSIEFPLLRLVLILGSSNLTSGNYQVNKLFFTSGYFASINSIIDD